MLSHRLCFSLSPSDLKRSIPISRVPLHPLYVAQVRPFQVALAANNAINGTENGAVRFKESGEASDEEASLPAGLRQDLMPNHVAVIMDGNRRWARTRGLPVASGYEAGVEALRRLVKLCCKWEIRVLTVFAFSLDNWFRPKVEIDFLMGLFENGLNNLLEEFARAEIRISVIGDSTKLPKPLLRVLSNAVDSTKNNSRLHLIVAVSYSGQYDVVQACQSIAQKVKDGKIEPKDIDGFLIEQELQTSCTHFQYPDLLIRTSGELRISNFMLWQLAYTELFFSQSHWPDFGETEFLEALYSFQQRQRRYGGQKS
nr:dehydrodolichyl diphosphate synthase 2-like [Ipomoea batatas]